MTDFIRSSALLFVLLNPFLVIIYLIDTVQTFSLKVFWQILRRAAIISIFIFGIFAYTGDAVFAVLLQSSFASFKIFGGIVFLIIGVQFIFRGTEAIEILRGTPEKIASALVIPIFIGPGSLSAAIIIGQRLKDYEIIAAIILAVLASIGTMLLLKILHDYVKPRNERIIERYIDVAGRIAALVIGTFSIEMILQGLRSWGIF